VDFAPDVSEWLSPRLPKRSPPGYSFSPRLRSSKSEIE
jgi:hypothetical protein